MEGGFSPFVQHCLEFALLGNQLPQNVIGLGALYLQHFLAAFQLVAGVLQVQHFLAEDALVFLHIGSSHLQVSKPLGIGGGNFIHHVHPVQHVCEAAGLEDDLPIGDLAVFLHGADALLVLPVQSCKLKSGGIQLLLGIGDHLAVDTQLLIDVCDLVVEQGNFLVDGVFLVHQCLDLRGIGVILGLNGIDLRLNNGVFYL